MPEVELSLTDPLTIKLKGQKVCQIECTPVYEVNGEEYTDIILYEDWSGLPDNELDLTTWNLS